jgi:hypothetical protein
MNEILVERRKDGFGVFIRSHAGLNVVGPRLAKGTEPPDVPVRGLKTKKAAEESAAVWRKFLTKQDSAGPVKTFDTSPRSREDHDHEKYQGSLLPPGGV